MQRDDGDSAEGYGDDDLVNGDECPVPGGAASVPGGILSDVRAHPDNPHASPFQHPGWSVLVLVWSFIAFCFALYNQFSKIK